MVKNENAFIWFQLWSVQSLEYLEECWHDTYTEWVMYSEIGMM